MSAVVDLPIDEIATGPNVRRNLHVGDALVESIARHGVLQPITVARIGGGYRVLYGHRRLSAARQAGRETIPAIVADWIPDDLALRQLAENIDRRQLSHYDIAIALRAELEANPGLSQATLAKQIGRHPTYVTNKLALLKLDKRTQRKVVTGRIRSDEALKARASLNDGRAQPRTEIARAAAEGRSASVVVPIRMYGQAGGGRVTIGVDFELGHVDLIVEDGADRRLMFSLAPEESRLLGRRLLQAFQAVAS